MRVLVVGIVVAMLATHARADSSTAKAAFEQGEKLVAQNKWAEACPYFEASFRADPQLGALLALAECHEQIGRIASSWSELKDALEIATNRNDPRRADIEAALKDFEPRVPKLKITLPTPPIAGLKVRRDDVDVTLLAGTDIPTDPGEHEVVAEAPERQTWKQKITLKEGESLTVAVPALDKAAVVEHVGRLTIKTAPDARITIDAKVVGANGVFDGPVKAGGHTLRVAANKKRTYQTEIVVAENDTRIIEVPLEDELVARPAGPKGPWFEAGAALATGVKLRQENPLVVALRVDLGFRLGRRINFGVYAEYASIDTSDRCGLDMPGPHLETPLDFGTRNQFQSCSYVLPGLQLYVHVRPGKNIDPYVGVSPGFKFQFLDYTEYFAGEPTGTHSEWLPGIVGGFRAGVNYHPRPDFKAWEVGGYIEGSVTFAGDESGGDMGDDGPKQFVTLFAGVRTSLQL